MLGFTQVHTLGSRPTTDPQAACVTTSHNSVFSMASSGHINTMVILKITLFYYYLIILGTKKYNYSFHFSD